MSEEIEVMRHPVLKRYMRIIDIDDIDVSPPPFFTLNRTYLAEVVKEECILNDDEEIEYGLRRERFVESTEEEFHAQRGIRKSEKFNL